MSKHTPGPWEITEYGKAGWAITTPFHEGRFRGVCSLSTENPAYIVDEEAKANARLIAVCPDMYIELIKIKHLIELGSTWQIRWDLILADIQRVINKAEGTP